MWLNYAYAQKCVDTDAGLDTSKRGKVIYQIAETENVKNIFVDRDKCISANEMLEHYCDESAIPQSKRIKCNCQQGVCKND